MPRLRRTAAKIPPPLAVGNPEAMARSIAQARPLVVERAERAQAIEPPPALVGDMAQVFARSDAAVVQLRSALREARAGNVRESTIAFGRFLAISGDARDAARTVGLGC